MRSIRAVLIIAVLAGLAGIGPGGRTQGAGVAAPAACTPSVLQIGGPTGKLVTAGNGLAFRLYDALAGNTGNVVLSPISVELALDMAYDGARGATAQGIAHALGLGRISAATARRQAASLLAALQASGDPKGSVSIASSLWARNGTRLRSRFTAAAAHDFGARVAHLDFASPAALTAINGWVACATHGTIPSILQRIPPDVMLYVLNAVYFQGQWTAPFNPKETHLRPFTTGSGRQIQAPTMDRIGTYPYYAGANVQVAALPYGSGRFQMVVAVPNGRMSLPSFRSQLTPAIWNAWIAGLRPAQGEVALPRFSVANTFQLNAALSSLGMGQAFSDSADFGGMCVQPCRLSEVRHKTFLKVYEAGTTASAATSVGVVPVAIPRASFHFVVNRPFFLAIRDSTTGAILFWGGINEP